MIELRYRYDGVGRSLFLGMRTPTTMPKRVRYERPLRIEVALPDVSMNG